MTALALRSRDRPLCHPVGSATAARAPSQPPTFLLLSRRGTCRAHPARLCRARQASGESWRGVAAGGAPAAAAAQAQHVVATLWREAACAILALLFACPCKACHAWPSQWLCQTGLAVHLVPLTTFAQPQVTESASCSADHTPPQVVVVVPKPKVEVCSGEIAKLCWYARMLGDEEAGFGGGASRLRAWPQPPP